MFKRGDIVCCVYDNLPWLTMGTLYAVLRGGRDILVVNGLGHEGTYKSERFILIEPARKPYEEQAKE